MPIVAPIGFPRFRGFDDNGAPLIGGKLCTYLAGSETPAITYSDSDGASPNPTEIDLDGRAEAVMYLAVGTSYKFVLKTADDVVLTTDDYVRVLAPDDSALTVDLSSQAVGKGASLVTWKRIGTSTAVRSVFDKLMDTVSVRDFAGLVGDGVNNDTAALQAALNSLSVVSTSGGTIYLGRAKCLIDTITIPANVTLVGELDSAEQQVVGLDYYAMESQLRLKPGATINGGRGAALRNCLVIRDGLSLPCASNASATTLLTQYGGTALTCNDTGFEASGLLILGFARAVDCTLASDEGRLNFFDVRMDCMAGIRINGALDICRLENCHAWPFMTAHVSGISDANLHRTGTAYEIVNRGDWSTLFGCFSYGFNKGFVCTDTSNVKLIACQADTSAAGAFTITGTSGFTYGELTGCTAVATPTGVSVDITGTDNHLRMTACVINAITDGVAVVHGSILATNNELNQSTNGFNFATTAAESHVIGNHFRGITNDFLLPGDVGSNVVRVGNAYSAGPLPTRPALIHEPGLTTRGNTPRITVQDVTPIATGNGGSFDFSAQYASAYGIQARIYASLVSGTAGSEANKLRFANFRNGSLVDRWELNHDGAWAPITDNTLSLGMAGQRVSVVYAGTGTINTSDEREKQDIEGIPDAVLDAVSEVNFSQFRFRDAVTEKGDGARLHTGVIAQQLVAAFRRHGVDPFAYGVLCNDQLEEGDRFGVRYEELMVLEAALMRRTVQRLEATAKPRPAAMKARSRTAS